MRKGDVDLDILDELLTRIFPRSDRGFVERTEGGTSTQVYKILRGEEVFYLRVAEEREASLAPEVRVHELLRRRGVRVPEVVYFEHFHEGLQRSVMLTTEIEGESIEHRPAHERLREALIPAGRDLAIINSISVKGFGWIKRDQGKVAELEAERGDYRDWALEHLDGDLELLREKALTGAEIRAIREIINRYDAWLDVEHAQLAHGDFDVTHIYQQHGRYTGIIDFGEIRGTNAVYDLGHFNLHDGERLPQLMLPYLLEGYGEVAQLPPDYWQRIGHSTLLIGLRALARSLRYPRSHYQCYLVRSIQGNVEALRA